MNSKKILFLGINIVLNLCALNVIVAQDDIHPPLSKTDFEQNYQWRIQQTYLSGQYIPKDLPDAISELNKLTDEVSRDKFKKLDEFNAEHKLYFSLVRWVCTNWGFYEGSRLSQYLREVGITYPEDQAISIVIAWHRTLNKKDINFKEIRDKLVEKRKKEREQKLKKAQVIKEEVIKPAPPAQTKN